VYDNLYRNTKEKWYDGTTLVRTIDFTFDANSRLTQASDTAATLGFAYDNLGRDETGTGTVINDVGRGQTGTDLFHRQ